jgi:hypothetical protein
MTAANGRATIVLRLSKYGGDRFRVTARLDGTELRATSPWVTVWRRLWYQLTHDPVLNVPTLDPVHDAYDQVYAEINRDNEVQYNQAWLDARSAGTNNYYPRQMVQPGAGANPMVPVIGTHNQGQFAGRFVADAGTEREDVKAHVVAIGAQYDRNDDVFDFQRAVDASPCDLRMPRSVLSPTIGKRGWVQALNWFVGGWFKLSTASGGFLGVGGAWRPLAATDIQFPPTRGAGQDRSVRPVYLRVTLPLGPTDPVPAPGTTYDILLRLIGADGPYMGVSFGRGGTANVCSPEYNWFANTVSHEIGHAVNMTPVDRDENGTHPAGFGLADPHPRAYRGRGGQGPHCHSVGDNPGVLVNGEYDGNSGTCIMFHKAHVNCSGQFCTICQPYLRAEPMTRLK